MKPAIHYAFEAKLIRRKKDNGEFDFIEVFKEFIDDDPIRRVKQPLSIIRIILMSCWKSKGLKYDSDKQAREALESFYDPKTSSCSVEGATQYFQILGEMVLVFL